MPVGSIRAITFDVGGTLIEPYPSVGHVYTAAAQQHGFSVPFEQLNERFRSAWIGKRKFQHTREDWAKLVEATFGDLVPAGATAQFFDDLYERFASPAAWRVYDDVRPTLKTLKAGGMRLGIISNWDERLRPLLKELGLDQFFETIVISCEAAACKPAAAVFQTSARQLGLAPKSILHVGDNMREDVEGAKAAGLNALLLDRSAESSVGVIDSLAELLH